MIPEAKDVVILASSSRSGSSMLARVLLDTRELVSTLGEVNPLFRMAGIEPANGPIYWSFLHKHQRERCATLLRLWLGKLTDDPTGFSEQVYARLCLQWPTIGFGVHQVEQWVSRAVQLSQQAWGPDFWSQLLRQAMRAYPEITPERYDLPADILANLSAGHIRPPQTIMEEPPFIVPEPWQPQTADSGAILLKGPAESYRLNFWRHMFPHATFRVLHLVRNPAATINGLIDGWLSPNFHSYSTSLDIAGYSHMLGGRAWWKFDLPPLWPEYRERALPDVCAYQWRAPHLAVLGARPDLYRVKFEDIIHPETRSATLSGIFSWLGLKAAPPTDLPIVMPTVPPAPGRWRARADTIRPQLARCLPLALELGYGEDTDTWV